jgi:hypothetical protein
MHAIDDQVQIVEGSARDGEAGNGSVTIVSARFADDVAHRLQGLVGQQAGLKEDPEHHSRPRALRTSTDVLTDRIVHR